MSKPLLNYRNTPQRPVKTPENLERKCPAVEDVAAILDLDLPTAAKILELMRGYRGGHDGNSVIIGGPTGWKWKPTLASDPQDHHGDFSAFGGIHHGHAQLSGVGPDNHHPRVHSVGSVFPTVADPGDLFYHLILKTLSVKQEV